MRPVSLEDGINPLTKWLLKPHIFSPILLALEKNFNKKLSLARVAVELVLVILKVRWSKNVRELSFLTFLGGD